MVPCYVLNFPEYHLLILENIAWEIYPTIRRGSENAPGGVQLRRA